MATQTANYGLLKPSLNDNADISVINSNMDIIDAKMKEIEDAGGSGGTVDAYTKQETDNLLSNKVDKVTGKGLSTNDYTNDEKNKLEGLSNYDDTEVRNNIDDINSNLDGLGYGENQGGSNIAWISKERVISDIGVQATYFDGGVSISQNETYNNFQIKVPCKRNTKYNYGFKGYSDGNFKQFTIGSGIGYSWDNIIERYVFTDSETLYSGSFSTGDYDFLTVTLYASSNIASGSMTIKNFYISETDMSYEPYIPSVKMLAEENVQQSTEAMDLKMLGWTVPRECPIQNEVSGNQFIQKVGRIKFDNVGILDIINNDTTLRMYNIDGIKKEWKETIYLDGYISELPKDYAGWSNANDKTIGFLSTYDYILIKDTSCGSIDAFKTKNNGKYIFYELATPITMTIDGNEVTERINESLSDYGLDNKFDGIWYQAYRDSATSIVSNNSNVCSNVFRCNAGDVIKLNYSNSNQTIYLQFWKSDGSSLSEQFIVGNKLELVAPQDASYVSIDISDIGITPQNVGNVTLYIANDIDQLKNDLSSITCFDLLWQNDDNIKSVDSSAEYTIDNVKDYDLFRLDITLQADNSSTLSQQPYYSYTFGGDVWNHQVHYFVSSESINSFFVFNRRIYFNRDAIDSNITLNNALSATISSSGVSNRVENDFLIPYRLYGLRKIAK